MDFNDIPLGFGFALAQNPDAMKQFSSLTDEERSQILAKAHAVSSRREMQSLVNSLSGR